MFDYPTHGGAQIIGFDRVEFDREGMKPMLIGDRLTFVLSGRQTPLGPADQAQFDQFVQLRLVEGQAIAALGPALGRLPPLRGRSWRSREPFYCSLGSAYLSQRVDTSRAASRS